MVVPCLFSSSSSALGRLPSELRRDPIQGKENTVGRATSPRSATFDSMLMLNVEVSLVLYEFRDEVD